LNTFDEFCVARGVVGVTKGKHPINFNLSRKSLSKIFSKE